MLVIRQFVSWKCPAIKCGNLRIDKYLTKNPLSDRQIKTANKAKQASILIDEIKATQ